MFTNKKVLSALVLLLFSGMMFAQNECVVVGTFSNQMLFNKQQKIQKVYLTELDAFDNTTNIDSATVQDGSFQFRHAIKPDAPALIYLITGFDNGYVPFFMEPGMVTMSIDAAFPSAAVPRGTKNNDLMAEYNALKDDCINEQRDTMRNMKATFGEDYINTPEGGKAWQRVGAEALVVCLSRQMEFLARHFDSPLAPLMFDRELSFQLDRRTQRRFIQTISPKLHDHPYYIALRDKVRALDLQESKPVPNIELLQRDGTKMMLNDLRGKYVLLDFWASWCAPCLREVPTFKKVFDMTRGKDFAIVSYSIDKNREDWLAAIEKHGLDIEGWIHASDLLGWESPIAVQMGVKAIPRTILIDPDGKAIAFDLRGEDLIKKVTELIQTQ